jgi:DNA (cytosine-5)-methyltransferase 1
MSKPRLLDLFCGAGGAAMGYHLAGFEVVGVDIEPQPHYPFEIHQADAMTFPLDGFDAIHASPPCQEYSVSRHLRNIRPHETKPMLIAPIRMRLEQSGIPWIIENVAFSDLPDALILCGSMFGLPIRRHRWFSSSHLLFAPGGCHHTESCINPIGGKVRGYGTLASKTIYIDAKGRTRKRESYLKLAVGQRAMEIDWMTMGELSQAIPPAYTEWTGRQLLPLCRAREENIA